MKLRVIFMCSLAMTILGGKALSVEQVIIPTPQSVVETTGEFSITNPIDLYSNLNQQQLSDLKYWIARTTVKIGRDLHKPAKGSLEVTLSKKADAYPSQESYRLEITPEGVKISAKNVAGLFYGIQSLAQLAEHYKTAIPAQTITDSPRFPYRGFMLDVSRNFRDKEFVKKQLDMMAYYKLNRFHWHLTDGAGWRLEIKKYPGLTQNAAWRPYNNWSEWMKGGKTYCRYDNPKAQGGFYTQNEVREVLEYARKLNITVIPEIEMPGHNEEVLAAYPQLACNCSIQGNSDLCAGNEQTFTFLQDVLTEVMDLFPSKYIHIGGDEASKQAWRECDRCKERMIEQKMTDVDQLQSYMIHRIETFLNSHNRNLLGWDEILQGGLAPNATVMSWRGIDGGITAAQSGHDAIMAPTEYCYLDYYQDDPSTQPIAMPSIVSLEKSYSFDPAPDSLSAQVRAHILGVQGNLWCEHIHTAAHVEYMIWPRLLAIAETGWSMAENKNFKDFRRRALTATDYLRGRGYAPFDLKNEIGTCKEASIQFDHLAKDKPVSYKTPYHEKYTAAGSATLTDGWKGTWSYSDKRWQGFLDSDMDITIDLGSVTAISSVWGNFMQSFYAYIWMPAKVEIYVSTDGEKYQLLSEIANPIAFDYEPHCYHIFKWEGKSEARYIRYRGVSTGSPGAWIFCDEIFVE